MAAAIYNRAPEFLKGDFYYLIKLIFLLSFNITFLDFMDSVVYVQLGL